MERTRSTPRCGRTLVMIGVAAGIALAGCDTGDGKTLREPVGTIAPTTTTTTLPDAPDVVPGDPALTATLPAEEFDFELFTPWADGAAIDARYTCDGEDVAPAFSWRGVPAEAIELAIVVADESVPNQEAFVHWAMAGISTDTRSVLEGEVPLGAVQALNFFGDVGWGGPCPPPGEEPHRYRFTLYALNQQVELADGTPATDLLGFVESVAIASTDVVGTYRR